jgi:chemotaxis protein MotA
MSASATGLSLTSLYDTISLLIVVGGSIAATAIAFKMKDVIRLFGLLKMIFKDDGFTLGNVVDDLCDLAEANRKGRKDFEAALQTTPQSMKF